MIVGAAGGTGRLALSGTGSTLAGNLSVGGYFGTGGIAGGTGVVRLDSGATGAIGYASFYPGGTLQLASAATLTLAKTLSTDPPVVLNQSGGTIAVELAAANLTAPDLTDTGTATLGGPLAVTFGPA